MKKKRSERFQASPVIRWLVPVIIIIMAAALLLTLALVLFLPVQ